MFPVKKGKSDSIVCRKENGPSFGQTELVALWWPFGGNNVCLSRFWDHIGTYNIGVDSQGRNMLTNQPSKYIIGNKVCWFTISELEVWKVKIV